MNTYKLLIFVLILQLIKSDALLTIKNSLGPRKAGRRAFVFKGVILGNVLDPVFAAIDPSSDDVQYVPPVDDLPEVDTEYLKTMIKAAKILTKAITKTFTERADV